MTSDAKRQFSRIPGYVLLLLAALLLFSCTTKQQIKGREFIPRDTLINVLKDMHLIDGITNDVKYYRSINPQDSVDIYGPIFKKYSITRERYEHTMEAYSRYPELLDAVYDDVLMELNIMQDDLSKEESDDNNVTKGGKNESLKKPGKPQKTDADNRSSEKERR
jgi:hypothetical protein